MHSLDTKKIRWHLIFFASNSSRENLCREIYRRIDTRPLELNTESKNFGRISTLRILRVELEELILKLVQGKLWFLPLWNCISKFSGPDGHQFQYRSVREHICFLNSLCHGMWRGNGWIFERSHDVAVNWKIESSWFWDAFDKKIAFACRKIISNASHWRKSHCWTAANSKVQFLIWEADCLTSLRVRQRRPRFWCKMQ